MPKVEWNIARGVISNFDRSTLFTPYKGKIPPNGVYQWRVKVLKYAAETDTKREQLRAGLELVPRSSEEKQYGGYFLMAYMTLGENNTMFWVPFLDAIGVSEEEFRRRTITKADGENIQRIGNYRQDGKALILAQLKDDTDDKGNPVKRFGWYGPLEDSSESDYDDESDDDVYDDSEDFEEPAPKARTTGKRSTQTARSRATGNARTRNRRNSDDDEPPF